MQGVETDFDQIVFKNTKFADILEDIFVTKKHKEGQINELIHHLNDLVKSINEAQMLVPLIKDYLDISTKNDDITVKLAAVIQRAISREKSGFQSSDSKEEFFTEEELRELDRLKEEAHIISEKEIDDTPEMFENEEIEEIVTSEELQLINDIKNEIAGEMSD